MKTTLLAVLLLLTGLCAWADTGSSLVMSTRGFARTSVLNNSANKEAITAYRFELPYGLAAGWRLPYLGFSEGAGGAIQLNGVLVAVPAPNKPAQRLPVTFAGQRTALVMPNEVVESDPINVPVAPGTAIVVYTYYRNMNAAGSLPFMTWGFTDGCDGCAVGDIGTLSLATLGDDTLLSSKAAPLPLNAGVNALIRSYQPMFITGRPHPSVQGPVMSVGFIGDSINIATGDFARAVPDDPYPARGWNGRACGVGTPYVVFGQSGSNAGGFFSAQHSSLFTYIFGTGAGDAKVTCLVDGYGINELRQQTKTKAPDKVWQDRLNAAGIARQLQLPYVQTTLTPMTAPYLIFDPTMGDQDARFAVFVSERKTFNEQVRTQSKNIPGCAGYIDWGPALETDPAASDNHWQAGTAMEGIHPNTEGYARMAKVATETLKTLRPQLSRDPAAPHAIRVACVGDSLTSGFRMEKPEQDAYPVQLGRLLGPGYVVRGFAEPGRTALRHASMPLWKEPVFADAQAWQPDMVVICLGSNDCWPDIWKELKAEFAGDLRDMATLFATLPSKPRVWLCVPTPMFCDNIEVQQQIMTREVIPAIRRVARETNSGLIDLYAPLAGHMELFMDDKVHPTPAAAAVMAQTVADRLQRRAADLSAPAWPPLAARDVMVCLGDSITDGFTFGQITIQALRDSGKPTPAIICAGAGGHTLTQMAARFDRDVTAYHPRLVTLNAGTNDVGKGVTPAQYEQTLREIIAKTKAIDAHLLIFTPCMIKNPQQDARAQQYTLVLRKVAAETGCLVAEDYALMCQARSCGREILVSDGVHPNYLGQSLMARTLLDALGYPDVPLPTEFTPGLFPGVVTSWQMRTAPVVDGKPQILDAESVKTLQADATWKPYTLPDPAPTPAVSAEEWPEQARRTGFGQQLSRQIGPGRIQAVATINSAKARNAFINTGAGVQTVWLNGEKLYTNLDWTGFHAGKERLPAHLHKGRNTLVIEITGDQFFLSVTNELIWERSLTMGK